MSHKLFGRVPNNHKPGIVPNAREIARNRIVEHTLGRWSDVVPYGHVAADDVAGNAEKKVFQSCGSATVKSTLGQGASPHDDRGQRALDL